MQDFGAFHRCGGPSSVGGGADRDGLPVLFGLGPDGNAAVVVFSAIPAPKVEPPIELAPATEATT